MDGDARNSDRRPKTRGATETIRRAQVFSHPLKRNYRKPNTEGQPNQATAGEQLEIIVVSFLRCHRSRRIVNCGNSCPVGAHADTQNRMGNKESPACCPNLISTNALVQGVSLRVNLVARLLDPGCQPVSHKPDSSEYDSDNEHEN